MDRNEIAKTVKYYFRNKDKYLKLHSLYRKPLYVFEKEILRDRADEFRKAFESFFADTAFLFAMKCNNHPEVLRTLLDKGYGADVSSGIELRMALDEGAREILFSGPGKTTEEITLAFENSERVTVLADSFGEIEKIDAVSRNFKKRIDVGIRLTTNQKALWRKFGIVTEKLPEFWEIIKTKPKLRFCGLQFHTSWNLKPNAQIAFIEKLGGILKKMPADFRKAVRFLDIGGGYWPPQGEWLREKNNYRIAAGTPIRTFAKEISKAVKKHIFPLQKCRICLEPGRWICNDAVQLLISVEDKKSEDLVITDAGTNAIGWERFESDYFPVLNLSRPGFKENPCDILGSLCTPHDVWGCSYWGSEIREGDVLLIPMQGAYTYSLRQNFIKPLPEFVAI